MASSRSKVHVAVRALLKTRERTRRRIRRRTLPVHRYPAITELEDQRCAGSLLANRRALLGLHGLNRRALFRALPAGAWRLRASFSSLASFDCSSAVMAGAARLGSSEG